MWFRIGVLWIVGTLLWGSLLPDGLVMKAHAEHTSLNIDAESVVLMDAKTGSLLYSKNMDQPMAPASTTKLVTAMIALLHGNLADPVTISWDAVRVEGTRVYLAEGETLPLEQLIYGLMVNSGNDAAIAIAEHISGSVEAFSEDMNAWARAAGARNTHFTNPHGLYEDEHLTTAWDLAKMAQAGLSHEKFREIASTNKYPWISKHWDTTLINHNKLIRRYEGATGIKNGYTFKSGHTLVASAQRGNTELIAVLMKVDGSERLYRETTELLDYGFAHYETRMLWDPSELLATGDSAYYLEEPLYITTALNEKLEYEIDEEGVVWVARGEEPLVPYAALQKAHVVTMADGNAASTDDEWEGEAGEEGLSATGTDMDSGADHGVSGSWLLIFLLVAGGLVVWRWRKKTNFFAKLSLDKVRESGKMEKK